MITRRQFEMLVERVVSRISEAVPVPNSVTKAKTGNFRYDAQGNSVEDTGDRRRVGDQVNPTAKTEMPPTMAPPTIAAPASATQKQADAELSRMSTKNPNKPQGAPSQKQIKVNAIKKALDTSGYTQSAANQRNATQNLSAWYDQLDPADALVATADELAQRFANGN